MLLDLSADGVRPTELSFAGSRQTRRLPENLVHQLKVVAKRYNATPFALLLAVFQIVLCQYSDEDDVIVGMPVAGRNAVELEDVIGLFANLVVVRTNLGGDPAFTELLREVRNSIVDALTNQDVPFERLVEALHPSRSLAQNPIFQVLFASVKAAAPWKNFGGLKASPYIVEASAVPFDLSLSSIRGVAATRGGSALTIGSISSPTIRSIACSITMLSLLSSVVELAGSASFSTGQANRLACMRSAPATDRAVSEAARHPRISTGLSARDQGAATGSR